MFVPIDSRRFAIQIVMVAGILSSHQVDAPRLCDKDTEYPHGDKCCKLCPAGTYVANVCERNHDTSTCEKCPPNTFAPDDNHLRECYKCRINPCDVQWEGIEVRNCTSYHDRECRCKKGMHRPRGSEKCEWHTPCPAGQGVIRKGSHRSDTRCQPCPRGTFSKRSSIFEKCKPWTNCAEEGLKTREEGNASRDAKCGGRLQPQHATPTPTSGPSHNTSATPAMDTPASSAAVPQSSGHEEAATSAATVTLASTTLGSVAVTSTPTTSQSASPTSSQSTSQPPGSDESTTTETRLIEDRRPGPNNQLTVAVSNIVPPSMVGLVIIIVFAVWCYYKKKEEREKIAGPGANEPPIGAIPAHHPQLPNVPNQTPQNLQERQALLPRMVPGEGELEPDARELEPEARGGENQQQVQIATGAPGGQINIQGLYQDQRSVAYDARQQIVNLQFANATVHQHFAIENPEFVQIGQKNTINKNTSTVGTANSEANNSEASDSEEPRENDV